MDRSHKHDQRAHITQKGSLFKHFSNVFKWDQSQPSKRSSQFCKIRTMERFPESYRTVRHWFCVGKRQNNLILLLWLILNRVIRVTNFFRQIESAKERGLDFNFFSETTKSSQNANILGNKFLANLSHEGKCNWAILLPTYIRKKLRLFCILTSKLGR